MSHVELVHTVDHQLSGITASRVTVLRVLIGGV
jgi:hypothetical protein